MGRILVKELKKTPLEDQELEIVERKGLGHPDYMCDSIMDSISIELNSEYMRRFGRILHYNADKSLLVAGEADVRFGGGKVKKPMLLVFGDRATSQFEGVDIPIDQIAVEAAKNWFRRNMRLVDPDRHVRYQVELKLGSAQLTDIFKGESGLLGANDTSAAVGYAPMSRTERAVLELERHLNSESFKRDYPESGEDVKVMALRLGNTLNVTIAMAFVDQYVGSEAEYFKSKEDMRREIVEFLGANYGFDEVNAELNTLDVEGRGARGIYLTVLGTSADGGDSGEVGRGNRVNGVIPLNRPMSSEAAAGKNPNSHVGKIYNVLSHKIADEIYRKVLGVDEVYVWLLSRIGSPINDPVVAAAELVAKSGLDVEEIRGQVREIIRSELDKIGDFCVKLANGEIPLC